MTHLAETRRLTADVRALTANIGEAARLTADVGALMARPETHYLIDRARAGLLTPTERDQLDGLLYLLELATRLRAAITPPPWHARLRAAIARLRPARS